jgi:hypothetical protein
VSKINTDLSRAIGSQQNCISSTVNQLMIGNGNGATTTSAALTSSKANQLIFYNGHGATTTSTGLTNNGTTDM